MGAEGYLNIIQASSLDEAIEIYKTHGPVGYYDGYCIGYKELQFNNQPFVDVETAKKFVEANSGGKWSEKGIIVRVDGTDTFVYGVVYPC